MKNEYRLGQGYRFQLRADCRDMLFETVVRGKPFYCEIDGKGRR